MKISEEDKALLTRFEEELWMAETRFDIPYMRQVMADDFFEFGRSGRVYDLKTILSPPVDPTQPIAARLPLDNLQIRLIAPDVAQVTYNSHVTYDGIVEHGRRSSIWAKVDGRWRLKFHQGTPYRVTASTS